jgi:hypothetical protein
MGTEIELFEFGVGIRYIFVCGVGWRVKCGQQMWIQEKKFPSCMLDAACSIKRREDQIRRKTRVLRTRVTRSTEIDGGIFENLL